MKKVEVISFWGSGLKEGTQFDLITTMEQLKKSDIPDKYKDDAAYFLKRTSVAGIVSTKTMVGHFIHLYKDDEGVVFRYVK